MKRFNFNELAWFVILFGFTFYFYYLLQTEKIFMYIAPRMIFYVKFSTAAFLILSLYQFTKIFTPPTRKSIGKSYLVLCITLLIGMISSQMKLDSSIADKRGVNMSSSKSAQINIWSDDKINGEFIEFEDESYLETLHHIEKNLESYKGKKIRVSGFVFKDKGLKNEEFIVGRMVMTCCAADSQIVGLVSRWKRSNSLIKDEWVKVEGIIEEIVYIEPSGKEVTLPLIKVESLEKIEKPQNVYIYTQ